MEADISFFRKEQATLSRRWCWWNRNLAVKLKLHSETKIAQSYWNYTVKLKPHSDNETTQWNWNYTVIMKLHSETETVYIIGWRAVKQVL